MTKLLLICTYGYYINVLGADWNNKNLQNSLSRLNLGAAIHTIG